MENLGEIRKSLLKRLASLKLLCYNTFIEKQVSSIFLAEPIQKIFRFHKPQRSVKRLITDQDEEVMENYSHFTDPKLPPIYEKVKAEERLSLEEGVSLYESPDITGVGFIANHVRERVNGNIAYYNINQHIDYSNVCILHARCHFCAFARKNMQTEGAWEMSVDEFLDKAMYSIEHGCTEIHSVGGLHPKLPFDYYLDMIPWTQRADASGTPQVFHGCGDSPLLSDF